MDNMSNADTHGLHQTTANEPNFSFKYYTHTQDTVVQHTENLMTVLSNPH